MSQRVIIPFKPNTKSRKNQFEALSGSTRLDPLTSNKISAPVIKLTMKGSSNYDSIAVPNEPGRLSKIKPVTQIV